MRILCFLGFCSMMSPGLLGQNSRGLTMVKQWNQLDYAYATQAERQRAIASGEFVPGNGVPIDTDVNYGNDGITKLFVTVPRFQGGIPATLATVTNAQPNENPLLMPYPSWEWHRNSEKCNTNRLVSVFRVKIDECGRLWVLDTGKIGSDQLCPPQVITFDPNTNQVLYRYEIPNGDIVSSSLLITPAVDVRDPQNGCRDTFIYAADVTGFGLVVVDVRRNKSWRIENKLFYPFPDAGTFTIAGESFDLMDGILGLALSPYKPGQDRKLYFHSLASRTENHVYTSVLRNESLFHVHADEAVSAFQVYPRRRNTQSAAEAMDKNGILYFGLLSDTSMVCWNSDTEYDERNFGLLERNRETLQFPSGVKIVTNKKNEEELWVLTSRFQKVMTGSITPTEVNFRIQAARTEDLLRDSKCKAKPTNTAPSASGSYTQLKRPQANWGGIFSSTSYRPTYARKPTAIKREAMDDKLIFTN